MDTSLYSKINDLMPGHNFQIHTLTEYDPSAVIDKNIPDLHGIFHEGHLIGILNTQNPYAVCTDIRYTSRLEILFQDIFEVFSIREYKFSAPDYQ